jgi:hypothetical protein
MSAVKEVECARVLSIQSGCRLSSFKLLTEPSSKRLPKHAVWGRLPKPRGEPATGRPFVHLRPDSGTLPQSVPQTLRPAQQGTHKATNGFGSDALLPVERATGLILDDPCFKEVALFIQVDHLAHPREGILFLRE